jgi:hypothetical protein
MLRYKDCSNIKEAATPKPSTLSDCSRTEAATCYVEIENQASVSGKVRLINLLTASIAGNNMQQVMHKL